MYDSNYNFRPEEPTENVTYRVSEPEPPKKKRGWAKFVALGLCCALAGGLVGGGGVLAATGALNRSHTTLYESQHTPVNVDTASMTSDRVLTAAQIYAANVNSCVGITTELVTTNYWGFTSRGAAAGSGFVISSDGYIVTNYHVIKGATAIKVAFPDGTSYDAALVGGEESNDVAVLKIDATGLTPVKLGDSDNLVVGESVYTIGNPLGELTWSLADGLVSALNRSVTTSEGQIMNMLQTNTAINSGNSGGPLFNAYGEVIGIVSAKLSNNGSSSSSAASIEGLGFAIPLNDVRSMIEDIIAHGYVTGRPNAGIIVTDVSSDAQRYGIPAGADVSAVLEGSCADQAGLKAGDIITAVDDTAVTGMDTLKAALSSHRAGDQVEFTLYRDGETMTLTLTLDESNAQRQEDLNALKKEVEQQLQQNQQNQQGQNNWPFNGYWPFG